MTVTTPTTSTVQEMRWPMGTCIGCAHPDCTRRRRERAVPCVVCGARIRIGQRYRVTTRINGEVVAQLHEECERRGGVRS